MDYKTNILITIAILLSGIVGVLISEKAVGMFLIIFSLLACLIIWTQYLAERNKRAK